MKRSNYKVTKIKPGDLELRGYLYQLLTFIDKRSYLDLAGAVTEHMAEEGLLDPDTELAFWKVESLPIEKVRSILSAFNILPAHLYCHRLDQGKDMQIPDDIEGLPMYYDSVKEVKMAAGSILVMYTAGGGLVDVVNDRGEKLEISDEDEENIGWHESNHFTSCKISHDKASILLEFLGRMPAHVAYELHKDGFSLKRDRGSHAGSTDNYYEVSEIEKIFRKRRKLLSAPKDSSVIVGSQEWMTTNLDTATFRNGDPIPEARSEKEWEKAARSGQPAWCHYGNNPEYGEKYGKLYNWFAVSDPRGLAPEGWHIPSVDEWYQLNDHLGEHVNRKLQGGDDWYYDHSFFMRGAPARKVGKSKNFNATGFSALPGGGRGRFGNAFFAMGDSAYWWTSTPYADSTEVEDTAFEVDDTAGDGARKSIEEPASISAGNAPADERKEDPDDDISQVIRALFGDDDDASDPSGGDSDEREEGKGQAHFVLLWANDDELQIGNFNEYKCGFSVRCIRDLPAQ